MTTLPKCKENGCNRPVASRGWCQTHYMRWRRHGDVSDQPRRTPNPKHWMYNSWGGMVNRCHNPNNSSYPRYGGRGIYVCDRWRYGEDGRTGFQCFLADMGERPEGKTLDRINPLGPYEPGNCRWATIQEQRANISPEGDRRMREASRAAIVKSWQEGRIKPRGHYLRAAEALEYDDIAEAKRRKA